MTKYIYAAVLISLVLLGVWVRELVDSNAKKTILIEQKTNEVISLRKSFNDEITAHAKDNMRTVAFQQRNEQIQNENDNLMHDINSGKFKLHIGATCPKLPSVVTDPARATDETAELNGAAGQAYIDLKKGIEKNKIYCDRAVERVQEDYENCGRKIMTAYD